MLDGFKRGTQYALLGAILCGLATASSADVRIEAGGTANFTDHAGNVWLADTGFTGGAVVDRGNIAIGNTLDPRIYQTEHYGMTAFAASVPNGSYQVNLHFAETYAGITGPGQRVFSVTVEGTPINNIDVFAEAGGAKKALIKTVMVDVADGQLNVTFTASVNNPEINGVEILPSAITATPTPTATPAPTLTATATDTASPTPTSPSTCGTCITARIEAGGTASFIDHNGNVWAADSGFTGGGIVDRGNIAIGNTLDPRIYQTEHYGMTAFAATVPNGNYRVNLHFAETYAGVTGAGQRVFSVNVEGTAINNLDVFAEAGGAKIALIKTVNVNVFDGQLNVTFTPSVNNAEINGIEILPGGPTPTATNTPAPTMTPTPGPTPTPGSGGGNISPLLVGNNVWNNPSDAVWNASAGARLRMIRIGGAAPDHNMPSIATLTGWVNHIKALGAEPLIQVSQYQSPAAAADIVRNFNVTTHNRVTYWNIGNEPWCQNGRPGDFHALANSVASYVKARASAMKAVDPTIKIFAPDDCDYFDTEYNDLFGGGGSADITGKDGNGNYYVDGLSWHRYVNGDLATAGANDMISRAQKARTRVDLANQLRGRTGADALQWGIGEFNAGGGGGVCSYANGQMFGQVLGGVMKYTGTYATTWSMLENGGSCTGTDFSFLNANLTPRASYYHMQMVSNNFSGNYASGASNVSSMRTYGAVDTDKIAVMLINVGGAQTCTVRLNNDPVAGSCTVNISADTPVTITQSIGGTTSMVLVFNRSGQLTKRITYASGSTPQTQVFTP